MFVYLSFPWAGRAVRWQMRKLSGFVSGNMIWVIFPSQSSRRIKLASTMRSVFLRGMRACDSQRCVVSDCSSPLLLLEPSDQRDTQHCWTHEWMICWRMNAALCGEHPIPLGASCPLLGCWSMHTYTLTHYSIILKNGHILWCHLISDSRWQNKLNSKSIPKPSQLLTKTAF